ncbi:hypothetical protein AAKU52_001859 [Pedobacter sp. CG_S7]|uniref:alpha-1,2-fucosyltransferase n=1 Tax=Pedobacter sp. CG_S7 TaxID=3143930 RepID=UPI00339800BD
MPKILHYKLPTTPNHSFPPLYSTIKEEYYHFNPQVLTLNNYLLNFKGYWHSENYFKDAAGKIKEELKFNNIPGLEFHSYKKEIERSENAVSIHIRRGDYVNHPEFSKTFGFIGIEYYQRAIELMKEKRFNCKYFVFTDDMDWVLKNFTQEENFVFVTNTGIDADLDDLHLMKLCSHNIIANSSFSWWGGLVK